MRKSALTFIVLVFAASSAVIHAASAGPNWVAPIAMAVKRVSDVPSGRRQPNLLSNLDCTELTYRLVNSHEMRTGCFTPTAFGMLDSDSDTVIFNGTDEGLPLLPSSPHQVLAPWPKALNLITLDAANTGGSYIGMYKNPLASIRDQRDWKGQLTAKQLGAPPDISFKDASGQPLIINPQTMAFSDGGSWLVAETLGGSFTRINLASLDRLEFAPAFGAQGSPGALLKSQVAVSSDGHFVAIGNEAAGSLKVYDLRGCGGGTCPAHEYRPFAAQQIGGLQKIRHIRFVNSGLLSFEATTATGGGIYELAPEASIDHLTDYIGLGDSYTSGEGAFDYLAGTDTASNTCHLSARSYPLLLTSDLFSAAGGHSVACSGAVIDDIGGNGGSYRGQIRHGTSLSVLQSSQSERLNEILTNYSPGYVPQEMFVRQYQPRVVTVSIGGNDIGFGDMLQKCVVPRISRHLSDETCYNTYESRQEVVNLVNRTAPRWTTLYRQLRAASPGAVVYAIGYPSVAADTGKCPLNVSLGKSELEFAEELIHYLDSSIEQAAQEAGVPYVDISQALAGHRLCEAKGNTVAVNGLTAGNDFGAFGIGLLGRESYHPNALGHQLIEQAILHQTDNLSVPADKPTPTIPDTGNLLDAPKTGRPLNRLMPDKITSLAIHPGQNIIIRINGAHDGLLPNSDFVVHLDGPEGPILGHLDSGTEGNINGAVQIPDNISPDFHAIDVIGPEQDGSPADITQSVYVPGPNDSANDSANDTSNKISTAQIARASLSSSTVQHDNRPAKAATESSGEQPLTATTPLKSHQAGRVLSKESYKSRPASSRRAYIIAAFAAALAVAAALIYYWRRIIKCFSNYFGWACNNRPKMDYQNCRGCFTIVIMRKFGVAVFSVVLFASLLILAFSASSNLAFTNQQKVEKWLSDSNVYGAFVESAIDQADQTAGTDQSGGVSLSDTAVKQAAESSFSSSVLKKDVHAFLNSNYAWLNGKTDKPSFNIDLTGAKQNFADRVGNYVTTYLKGLPVCSAAQTAKLDPQTTDPLTLDCRPARLNAEKTGAQISEQIANSTEFLDDPVLTANNFNPGNNMDSADQPYYQQLSGLPGVYQKATLIPWVAGLVSLLSLAAIFVIAARRRNSLKVVTVVFGLAGLVMVSTKLVSDQAFRELEKHAFNQSTVGELQKALTVFFHHVENQLVKVDLWFGIGYLLIALVILIVLITSRQKGLRMPKRLQTTTPVDDDDPPAEPADNTRSAETPMPTPKPKPRRKKPPRLIQ